MGCLNSKAVGPEGDNGAISKDAAAALLKAAEDAKSLVETNAAGHAGSQQGSKGQALPQPAAKTISPIKTPTATPKKAKPKPKPAPPPPDEIPSGEPVVPLVERAVHPLFLAAVCQVEVEMEGRGRVKLGDLFTHEVVSLFVKPQTAHTRMSIVETLALMVMDDEQHAAQGHGRILSPSSSNAGSRSGAPGSGLLDVLHKYQGWAGGAKPFQGPTTYFLSHAWCYKLGDLRDMAKHHYEIITGSMYKYDSVFYWIDIFAVSQNFTGDFTKHPDGNFPSVIREAEGVVFTMFPWNKPIAPTRIWCLFEAITAVETGVSLELLVDPAVINSKLSLDQLHASFKETVQSLDIGAAQATVESDRQMILDMVRSHEGGIPKLNTHIQELLQSRMWETLLLRTVAAQDTQLAGKLLDLGATFFHRHLKFKTARITDVSAEIIAGALKTNTTIQSLDLSPPNDKGLLTCKGVTALSKALFGNATLLELDLSHHRSLGDEGIHSLAMALGKGKNSTLQTLRLTRAGVDDVGATELAAVLQVNSTLTCLDLASNEELREEGTCALMDGLQLNLALRKLDLTAVKMSDRSVWIALGNMLKHNNGLEVLVLSHCGLCHKAVPYLGPGLEANGRLVLLDLSKNAIEGRGLAALAPHLARNQGLRELMLAECNLDGEGAAALREVLRGNNNLVHVSLAGNKVYRKEWEDLMAHTSGVTTLVSIDTAPATGSAMSAGTVVWVPTGMAGAELLSSPGGSLLAPAFKTTLVNSRSHISICGSGAGGAWTPLSSLFSQGGGAGAGAGGAGAARTAHNRSSVLYLLNSTSSGGTGSDASGGSTFRHGSAINTAHGPGSLTANLLQDSVFMRPSAQQARDRYSTLKASASSPGAGAGGFVTPKKPIRPGGGASVPGASPHVSSPELTLSPGPLELRAKAAAAAAAAARGPSSPGGSPGGGSVQMGKRKAVTSSNLSPSPKQGSIQGMRGLKSSPSPLGLVQA